MSNNSKNIGEKVWHEKTRLGEDNCYNDSRVDNSKKPGDYNLQTNIRDVQSDVVSIDKEQMNTLKEPGFLYRDGYGWAGQFGSKIDNDTYLRNGSLLTNKRDVNQLFARPFATTPYMGNSRKNNESDIETESKLISGENTNVKRVGGNNKQSNKIDRFEPLVSNILDKQNYKNSHLGLENKLRSGNDTKEFLRHVNYKNCLKRI